jgi:hypothetical protein
MIYIVPSQRLYLRPPLQLSSLTVATTTLAARHTMLELTTTTESTARNEATAAAGAAHCDSETLSLAWICQFVFHDNALCACRTPTPANTGRNGSREARSVFRQVRQAREAARPRTMKSLGNDGR